jgi:2-oxoglutarate ferredoxin oxidoreductase subunit alpha
VQFARLFARRPRSRCGVAKQLMSGNHALAEAAIRAGCRFYFGYPITPQNEVPEYMSENLPRAGGTFIQGESEIASISMVLGAAVTGARAMTSSSSPGISLKQEGVSFLAGQELPAVIVNMTRGGPGLGNIAGSQGDYFQATRGGGHGDYRTMVLAPASVQELVDLTMLAFELADKYRNPVVILGDGLLAQMREPVVFPEPVKIFPEKDWALRGAKGRPSRFSRSLILDTKLMEEHNWKLKRKYQEIEKKELRWETFMLDDAMMAVIAYGSAARIVKGAIKRVRREGIKAGLIRPVTLWPFPSSPIQKTAERIKQFIVFELNTGQMLEDVKLALDGRGEIYFYGRPGGPIPTPLELAKIISSRYSQKLRRRA